MKNRTEIALRSVSSSFYFFLLLLLSSSSTSSSFFSTIQVNQVPRTGINTCNSTGYLYLYLYQSFFRCHQWHEKLYILNIKKKRKGQRIDDSEICFLDNRRPRDILCTFVPPIEQLFSLFVCFCLFLFVRLWQ